MAKDRRHEYPSDFWRVHSAAVGAKTATATRGHVSFLRTKGQHTSGVMIVTVAVTKEKIHAHPMPQGRGRPGITATPNITETLKTRSTASLQFLP